MTRTVGNTTSYESVAPTSKRPKRVKDVLPSSCKHSSQPFWLESKEHILVAQLQVRFDPDHACVKRVHAFFELRTGRQTYRPVNIGYLHAQTIDRLQTGYHQTGNTLFVTGMLNKRCTPKQEDRPMDHSTKKEVDETEIVMQHIFHRDGTPRKEYARWSLGKSEKLHFIDAFQLKPAYRGCGLSKIAMHTYLQGIQKLEGRHKFLGPVILSPAALCQDKDFYAKNPSRPAKTLVEIEYALIASYERAGFQEWSKGDDRAGGSAITIMGLRLVGPKIARISTERLSPEELASSEITFLNQLERVDSGL
ncbi:uncharacterized protein RCC_04220 [Ramularia collo-cygni]|uniref:Uncharacterized protein n=1 Tax=Ramularia collo-cygni TaxID=112498 RepID=A0A2D3V4C0_9PEZI|nr:uncharacterized protein RCC_04220 [Ramularia collo-cygni]CZT18376.1 uncharacterized protein RCC_04220 [Ramularia collo-cygni]